MIKDTYVYIADTGSSPTALDQLIGAYYRMHPLDVQAMREQQVGAYLALRDDYLSHRTARCRQLCGQPARYEVAELNDPEEGFFAAVRRFLTPKHLFQLAAVVALLWFTAVVFGVAGGH